MDRVMVDIETLGLKPGSAILSIGAVKFDKSGIGETFERNISLESCKDAGLEINPDTLEWWLSQDGDVQHVLTGGIPLTDALEAFSQFYGNSSEIWAFSPAFDCVHLQTAYDAVGIVEPWDYYEQRDCRTLLNLPQAVEMEQDGNEHDALDDAVYQARQVQATLEKLQ